MKDTFMSYNNVYLFILRIHTNPSYSPSSNSKQANDITLIEKDTVFTDKCTKVEDLLSNIDVR